MVKKNAIWLEHDYQHTRVPTWRMLQPKQRGDNPQAGLQVTGTWLQQLRALRSHTKVAE